MKGIKISSLIWVLLIVFVAFAFVIFNGNYQIYIFDGDQASYFESGSLLFNKFEAHPFRTFGYGLFLGLPEILGINPSYFFWPILLNIIFLIGIIWISRKFEKLINIPISNYFSLGLLMSIGFIKYMSFALTETGFAFFILLASYKFYQLILVHKSIDVFYFYFFLGFASLFKPGLYLYTLLIVLIYILYILVIKKFAIRKIYYIILGLILTIGVQSLLMKKTYNTYRLTYIDDITWYRYGGALANTIYNNNCFSITCFRKEQAKRDSIISNLSNDEMAMIAKADRKEILFKKTNAFIKMMKINISTNLLSGSFKESTWLNKWTVFNNLCLSILPFILYLVVLFSRFRRTLNSQLHLVVLFMLGVIAYTIITSGISAYQGDRFHIAFYPLSLLTIAIIIQKIRNVKLT